MAEICVSPRYAVRTRLTSAGSPEEVWLAEDLALDSQVVLKKIPLPGRVQEDTHRLLGLCDAFLSLSHPGLARPLRFCPALERGSIWLASEHVPGEAFLPTIRSLSLDTLLRVLSQLCSVLHYLHSRGYAHLDLHPGNVLLVPPQDENEPWTLKIIDLPLFPLGALNEHRELLRFHPGFSAPEVLAGAPFDHRADLYSLGSLFYTAFVGEPPPKPPACGDPAEPHPAEILPSTLLIPAYLLAILRNLLEHRVERRASSAYFLLEDINASLRAHQLPPLPPPEPDGMGRSVPLIPTPALDSSIIFLESWLQSRPPRSTFSLAVRGMPGSGCTRLTRALGIYLALRGCGELVLQPHADSGLLGWEDSLLSPSGERTPPSRPCFILGKPGSLPVPGDIAQLASCLESSVLLLSARDAGFALATPTASPSPADEVEIPLSPLTDPQCKLYIDRTLHPNNIPDDLKTALAHKALNIPGLLSHVLDAHVSAGDLQKRGPLWEATASFSPARPIPPEAAAAFRPAFQSLPQLDSDLLALLSMARGPTPLSVLAEVLSAAPSTVVPSLEALGRQGLVEHDVQKASLKSPTVCHLLTHLQDPGRLTALADRALSLLRSKATQQPSPLDALLSSYAIHAQSVEDVLHYSLRASEHFESINRLDEALVFCEQAVTAIGGHDAASQMPVLARCLGLLDKIGDKERFACVSGRLERLLPQHPSREHIRLYHLLAKHFSDCNEFNRSTRYAGRAIAIAKQTGLTGEISECLVVLGQIRLRQGRPLSALRTIKRCLRMRRPRARNDSIERPASIIAGAYYMEGNYPRALKYAKLALGYASGSRSGRPPATTYNNFGILLMESGRLPDARRAFRKCRTLAEASGEFRAISHCHGNLGVLTYYSGEMTVAVSHARMQVDMLKRTGTQYGLIQSLLSLAEVLPCRGYFDEAMHDLEKAGALARENGIPAMELLAGLQRGWVLLQLGDYGEAARAFADLETPLEKAGYRVHRVSCALGLVNADIALGDLDSAGRRLDGLPSRLPRQHIISDLLYRISRGRFCAAKGDLPSACRAFICAGSLARRLGYRPYDFEAHLALAQCLLTSGETEEAGRVLRRLVGLNERIKYRLLEPWLHAALADYAEAAGRVSDQRRHLLNARTALLELSSNIADGDLRGHFLNRPDSRALLQRSENVEDILYVGFAPAPEEPRDAGALESIARINEQLYRRDSLKSTLALIVDEALRLSRAERGIIFLFDPSGREEMKVARGIERRSLLDARKYTRTALRRIRSGEMVYAADTFTDPQFDGSGSVTDHRIRSVACVPLRSHRSIIGALYLDGHRPGLAASAELLKSLEIFAQQAAAALERAVRYFHVTEENRVLRQRVHLDRPALVGQGAYFTRLKQLIAAAAGSELPVLILGESGTGKELVARAIHESGKRCAEPFLSVDCGALPENLVESELFGYCRGAFTGADRDKEGLLVAARDGTLLLDEIANTSLPLQAKLLRALQEREIRPLGATDPVPFKARVLAATNRDLRREAREGKFREDLLFRLNGLSIVIPPLRDRKGDLPLLLAHFLQKTSDRLGRRICHVSDEALQALTRHDWPGNIRELENCIERAAALARTDTITLDDLPESIRSATIVSWSEKKGEHLLIEEALRRFTGDKTRAADYIGWNRQKLYRKMTQYNIPMDFGRRNTA